MDFTLRKTRQNLLGAAVSIFCIAVIMCLMLIAGCSTAQQQTAAQVLTKLQVDVKGGCQVFQAAEPGVQIFIAADPAVNTAVTAINGFCSANSVVTATSLQAFVSSAIPAAESAVNSSTLIPQQNKGEVVGILSALGAAISTALLVYNNAVVTAPSGASAPVAASS
jgi:hypothetical protein